MKNSFIIVFFFPFFLFAQDKAKIDSLKNVIDQAKHDTTIVSALLSWSTLVEGPDPALHHDINIKIDSICRINLDQSLSSDEKSKFIEIRGIANNNLGFVYSDLGNHNKALHYHETSMRLKEQLGDKVGVAGSYNNIGNLFKYKGDYRRAIEYLTKSLSIKEELGDKKGIANSLNNIGNIYRNQGDYDIAMDFHRRSLKIKEDLGYKKGIASSLNNIGIVYVDQGMNDEAIKYFKKSLKIKEELGSKKGISSGLNNIADTYLQMGRNEEALDYCLRGLKLREEIDYKKGIASSLANLSMIYTALKKYDKAIEVGKRSLKISNELGAREQIKDVSKSMWIAYKEMGNFQQALIMHEMYREQRDTLESEENKKAIFRQEYKYQYEKQAAADSVRNAEEQKIKDAELAVERSENEKQKQRSYFLYGGLALALIFGVFIFSRFRVTRNQKIIIQDQKAQVDEAFDELEEKNNEILDSITYAKRIQSAILPSDETIKEYLPNSFVLYKPKDIVAGDFYWMEVFGSSQYSVDSKQNEPTTNHQSPITILIAAADCTGHGVPGAMVSVVCNNGLNRSVREFGITDPGKILDKTRELVTQEFEKSYEDVRDGMDIALVSFAYPRSSSESREAGIGPFDSAQGPKAKLSYAGAHNPLWIIRKGSTEIEEIKATKQPIGKYHDPQPFQTHNIELSKGDLVYISTDGYADQFGGSKGKKLKSNNFKDLLLSIQDLSMTAQKEKLDFFFEEWCGENEQIDDVCIIGIRI